jgi:ankyrin repeat protein
MKAESQELLDNHVSDLPNLLMIAARCNVDIQDNSGRTALQVAQLQGHAGIATLIRNKNHKGADRAMKGTLLQVSPEKAKKQQEDADRAMKELLEAEEKSAAAAAACMQKKKKAKKRTEAKAESEKKPENVSGAEAAAAEMDDAEEKEERKREAAEWNEAEATPQVIQGFWLSQEQDDVMAYSQEAGGAAAGATADVEAISWPASLQADVKQAPDIMSAAADTNEPNSMFMAHDDLQDTNVPTALQVAQLQGQEDADRAMKELLVEERDAAAAAAVSQKKKQAKAEAKSEKKTANVVNVAAAAVTAAFKDKVGEEEERKREAAERKEAGIVYYIQSLRNSALIA